jgi:hypothetical protein
VNKREKERERERDILTKDAKKKFLKEIKINVFIVV